MPSRAIIFDRHDRLEGIFASMRCSALEACLSLISTTRSRRSHLLSGLFVVSLLSGATARSLGQSDRPLDQVYAAPAKKLIAAALDDTAGYANLAYLCDHIGKRPSGSESLGRAITWSADLMRKEGLQNVTVQKVMVPHWVRGQESGAILSPVTKPLHMLGLGMSVATPPGGLDAEVVVVNDFAELAKLGRDRVQGKIVVFNAPYEGYGRTVMYRVNGPSRAAALGAVAVLVRSITPLAVQLPHTGTLVYDKDAPQIPAAAISIEDALMLARLTAEGSPVRVHLDMQAHLEPEAESANVMGEIVGTEHPEEVVVLGGHIDSWDVGQGAQDDGSGIMATLEAVNLIKQSGLRPKRTIRIVFWVNEENGGAGGKAYRANLGDSVLKQVAAIEMDGGAEAPDRLRLWLRRRTPLHPQRPRRRTAAHRRRAALPRAAQADRHPARARRRQHHASRRRRLRHRTADGGRRSRPGRTHHRRALLRLASHRGRYTR